MILISVSRIGRTYLQQFRAGNVTFSNGSPGADIAPLCEDGVACGGLFSLDPINYDRAAMESNFGYFYFHHTRADSITHIKKEHLTKNVAAFAIWSFVIAENGLK